MQKSISELYILPTLFWCCIDIFPDRIYIDACLTGFLHSHSLMNPLGNKEVFVSVFPAIRHSSAINDIMLAKLNSVVEIIGSFVLRSTGLDVVTKLYAEDALVTVIEEVAVDRYRSSRIPFHWSFLESSGNCCSGVVTCFGLQC